MPDDVVVSRKTLLDKLRENREAHREFFEKALDGWERRVLEELTRALEDARSGKRYSVEFNLPQPRDHTNDYDRAISMLEMEVRDEVTITQREFAQMVLDDWGWKPDFVMTNSAYLSER